MSRLCGTGRMMDIMGAWKSNICPFLLKEVETILYILKFHHPDMAEISVKETSNTSKNLEAVDTNPTLQD